VCVCVCVCSRARVCFSAYISTVGAPVLLEATPFAPHCAQASAAVVQVVGASGRSRRCSLAAAAECASVVPTRWFVFCVRV